MFFTGFSNWNPVIILGDRLFHNHYFFCNNFRFKSRLSLRLFLKSESFLILNNLFFFWLIFWFFFLFNLHKALFFLLIWLNWLLDLLGSLFLSFFRDNKGLNGFRFIWIINIEFSYLFFNFICLLLNFWTLFLLNFLFLCFRND